MADKLKKYRWETVTFILWLAGVITVSLFHEPWFDEIQAWQIAKTTTWHELFFEIPHSECHPLLWHLILRPFAMAGLPFEPAIKTINILITSVGCAIFMFRTSLPKPLKLILPFSFMIFYQTAVVNRCYSLLFVEFILLALYRKDRDEKPLPFIISIAFLCMTHVLGIMIGGLICLIWVIGIIGEYRSGKSKGNILKDKRTKYLACLFVFAVLIMIMIFPSTENTNFSSTKANLPTFNFRNILACLQIFLGIPFETTFDPTMNKSGFAVNLLFFALINAFMYYFGKKRKCRAEYFVPYLTFSLFYTFVWYSPHTLQVLFFYMTYIITAFYDENDPILRTLIGKLKNVRLQKMTGATVFGLFILMPASAAASCVTDICHPYFEARPIADFIKDNGLEDLRIFSEWEIEPDAKDKKKANEDDTINADIDLDFDVYTDIDVRRNICAITLEPYFDHHVISNNYTPEKEIYYMSFKISNEKDRRDCYEKFSKGAFPDIIIGNLYPLETIFGKEEVEKHHFKLVYRTYYNMPWKFDTFSTGYQTIWMREDLLEQYGVKEVRGDYNTVGVD
ncbi:hypothetical protein SAMN02910447_02321 [Ruminococcus sp. YE71]|uniref:hypothetical protein n=1 Tax=unclassified Ruminococcus TaxID=2608920 RepID=UPI0008802680|nr:MULTISPECIES: hypothetical protein [unclassified Ruminococcus]SDA23532.1 hypothetical protein SAMN02910446_02188 [Ruminococcus sp. YE78]SFW39986.1 hypothetical protein SAMN02910447_02321 [Ruminococcus sp. YE71]